MLVFRKLRVHTLLMLVKRDFQERYKGSILGLFWAVLHPLLLLIIYTIVFSQIFKLRWAGVSETSQFDFSIILFSGLMLFNVLAEVLGRSTSAINSNANFVKKMVFPISLLPLICVASALINFCFSFMIWFIFVIIVKALPNLNSLLLPIVILPIIILAVGLSYFLSALTVFFRDLGQITGISTTALLFLSPIFYDRDMVPQHLQTVLSLNPLTKIIENFRQLMIWGETPRLPDLIAPYIVGIFIFVIGFLCFSFLKSKFADTV